MENDDKQKELLTKSDLVTFAFEVGSSIALPLVVFALGGRLLDRNFDTSPIFLISGLLLSLIATGIIIAKKVKKLSN